MRSTLGLLLAAAAPLAVAKTTADVADMGSVTSILEGFYGTNVPAKATGAAATSLAAALYNFENNDLSTDEGYVSAADAIYMAIATATNAEAMISTLEAQGVMNTQLYTTSTWWTTAVPTSAQSAWNSLVDKMHSIETSALAAAATATATSVSFASPTGYGYSYSDVLVSATGASHKSSAAAPTSIANATITTATPAVSSIAGSSVASSSSSTAAAAASASPSTGAAMGPHPASIAMAGVAAVVAAAAALY
jgi:hypothetical protein